MQEGQRFFVDGLYVRENVQPPYCPVICTANHPNSAEFMADALNKLDPPKAEPQPELFLRKDGSRVKDERREDLGRLRKSAPSGSYFDRQTGYLFITTHTSWTLDYTNKLCDRRATKWEPVEERKGPKDRRAIDPPVRPCRRFDGNMQSIDRRVTTGSRADRKDGEV